jgi:hypothetical protein
MCVHCRIRDRAEERLAWLESEACRRNVMAQVAVTVIKVASSGVVCILASRPAVRHPVPSWKVWFETCEKWVCVQPLSVYRLNMLSQRALLILQ